MSRFTRNLLQTDHVEEGTETEKLGKQVYQLNVSMVLRFKWNTEKTILFKRVSIDSDKTVLSVAHPGSMGPTRSSRRGTKLLGLQ